jgi:stage II sporulation protein D
LWIALWKSCASSALGARLAAVRKLLITLVLLAFPAAAEEIRIELAKGGASARIEAGGVRMTQGGRPLEISRPLEIKASRHEVSALGGALFLDGRKLEGEEPLIVEPGPEGLRVDGKPLPGRLEAWADPRGLALINVLELDDYVAAVVASEVPKDWPDAALEAQAVAARTFAVAQKIAQGPAARAHLGASVLDQVYAGAAHPESGALRAAQATAGEVLTYGAAPIAAYFSASCGGRSETAEAAFNLAPGSTPYLVSEADDADPGRGWVVRKPLAQISEALRQAGRVLSPVTSLTVSARTGSGRARTLRIDTKSGARTLAAVELRQILGYGALPSLLFDVTVKGDSAVFRGRGNGHGVGLCQWGARARARRGETYRQILAHYYPGSELRRMY